ncbi:patatin-like phospholipase family protein [Methyloceanibacter sp.]|uniref:patatin-like phospholipase family protein n=1 Tax=Methyloceanibacter sp. TaxID=1965321 RepID=UPI002089754A|nr:patatin-like phospholipase family protein [Methyloceanibacter sp.]GFO82495.1 MAG: phospholipase [Methyloceanibacter sp.]HML91962.1 patatin-like phospholipase family protein [Methyloceanibacter sp.]
MVRPIIGLALGGGSARGWAHIGALNTLIAAGVEPDVVVGTSIGAVAGACYVTGTLDRLEAFARSLTRRRIFGFLDFNLAGSGLITGQRLSGQLENHLSGLQIEDLSPRFAAVATELATGHEVWLNKGDLVPALNASFALPGIFKPVEINGQWMIDGALVNPVPVSVCRALGARIVIAVNVTSDPFCKASVIHDHASYTEPTDLDIAALQNGEDPAQDSGALRLLHRQLFGRGNGAPGISSVMMAAINITQDRIARSRLAGDPPDITINPKTGRINLFDFHRADEAIALGAKAAESQLDEIRHTLNALAA